MLSLEAIDELWQAQYEQFYLNYRQIKVTIDNRDYFFQTKILKDDNLKRLSTEYIALGNPPEYYKIVNHFEDFGDFQNEKLNNWTRQMKQSIDFEYKDDKDVAHNHSFNRVIQKLESKVYEIIEKNSLFLYDNPIYLKTLQGLISFINTEYENELNKKICLDIQLSATTPKNPFKLDLDGKIDYTFGFLETQMKDEYKLLKNTLIHFISNAGQLVENQKIYIPIGKSKTTFLFWVFKSINADSALTINDYCRLLKSSFVNFETNNCHKESEEFKSFESSFARRPKETKDNIIPKYLLEFKVK